MTEIYTISNTLMKKVCKTYIHFSLCVYLLVTSWAIASEMTNKGRRPANFVPDDDLIVVPMVVEKSVIERFNERHQERFYGARKQLEFWMSQEQYAFDYGLEDSGFVVLPTEQEKQRFFQRNYLRFLSKDVERSTNRGLQNSWERWTADNEIDAIEAIEQHEKVLVYAKKKNGKAPKKVEKSVKVGRDRLRFGFQPRIEIGMLKFTMRSNFFYARAWVGVNGNQELNVEKTIDYTNTKLMGNYFIDEERLLVAVDQPIWGHWSFRFTHTKLYNVEDALARAEENLDPQASTLLEPFIVQEDNIAQIRFNMAF